MVHGRTLWELLERRVDTTPDALMIVDEDMRTLTFAEYWAEAELAAAGLAAAGIAEGDVVSWQLPNWVETFVLLGALSRIGAVQNPLSMSLKEEELDRIVDQVGPTLLVVPTEWEGRETGAEATSIAQRHPDMRVLLADRALPQGDPTSLPELPMGDDPEEQLDGWLFHTAGTTADPKVVRHSDGTIAAAARGLAQRFGLIPRDRSACMLPASHIEAVAWLFASLIAGSATIVTERFDDEETCEVLAREGVTLAGSTSGHQLAYVQYQRQQLQPAFPDVRAFPHGGGRRARGVEDDVAALFGVPILPSYGSTEAPLVAVGSIDDSVDPARGSAEAEGRPVADAEIRAVRTDGTLASPGEDGELRVRAPQLMLGYLDRTLDLLAFDADGFFRTGDVGHLDARGAVVVTGRIDDVVVPDAQRSNGVHALPDQSQG